MSPLRNAKPDDDSPEMRDLHGTISRLERLTVELLMKNETLRAELNDLSSRIPADSDRHSARFA